MQNGLMRRKGKYWRQVGDRPPVAKEISLKDKSS